MRKLLTGLVLVLLSAAALVAAFLFVPSPLQKWAVERGATMATGRQVSFGVPFRLRVWPPLTITAADIRVANADWGQADELVGIGALDASVDLLAYWREHRIVVNRLLLTRPQLHLEVAPDGRQNWTFAADGGAQAKSGQEAAPTRISGFLLGSIRIEDGVATYDDRKASQSRRAEKIDLALAQAGADAPLTIDGGLTMEGQRATLGGSVAQPQAMAAGEPSPVALDLRVPGGSLKFDGTLNTSAPAANGSTQIDLSDPRVLTAWLGQELALPDGALRTAGLEAELVLTAKRVALDQLRLRVDELDGKGRAAATLGAPVAVEGELSFGRLDLTPYLAPPGGAGKAPPAPTKRTLETEWSDAPLDLPLPLPIDLDFRVRAADLKAPQIELGATNVRLQSDRQQAAVTIDELQAYDGKVTGNAQIRAGTPPNYALKLQTRCIHLLAALQALARQGRFDGHADIDLAVKTAGDSERELMRNLGGDGRIVLRDGAVLGINIAGMLRQIMTLGLIPGATQQQRTDFAEAGASFKIQNGIVRNDDFYLRAPVLRLAGAGTVDLPQRTVDYRITPQLATTLEGQGASGEPVLQAGIPFLIQGPVASPAVRFDLNGTLTSAISSPADLARVAADLAQNPQAVQVLKEQFDMLDKLPAPAAGAARGLIEGVLGGEDTGKKGGSQRKGVPDLGNTAKDLLKGFGR